MAVSFLNGEISELCLGKPELTWISSEATVAEALAALKTTSGECHISVWTCNDNGERRARACVGKICMANVILFLCREENRDDPLKAYEEARVSDLLPKGKGIVRHLDSNSRLWEAMDFILEGAQNLIIPMRNNARKHCWLTQEDIIRYILNSIASFSPIPTSTVDSLRLIDRNIPTVHCDEPASSILELYHRALIEHTSVAVVDDENRLVGEVSPLALCYGDEAVSASIMGLSVGELVSYMDHGPHEDLVRLVRTRLRERNLTGMLNLIDELTPPSPSSSSDDECWPSGGRSGGSGRIGPGPGRRFEVVACGPKSSLVAVMIQALAHRVNCVWVVEGDRTLVGAVTFAGILKVFRGNNLN